MELYDRIAQIHGEGYLEEKRMRINGYRFYFTSWLDTEVSAFGNELVKASALELSKTNRNGQYKEYKILWTVNKEWDGNNIEDLCDWKDPCGITETGFWYDL